MNYLLFLDDERVPADVTWLRLPSGDWVVVRSYEEFVAAVVERGLPGAVSFDHDLADKGYFTPEHPQGVPGGRELNGASCARWLAQRCIDLGAPLPAYTVHSQNTEGKDNIRSIMESARRLVGEG